MIEVRPIDINSKKELGKFIKFPWEVYKEDKNRVQPLIMDVKEKINKKTK